MKRLLSGVLALLLCIEVLSGCGKKENGVNDSVDEMARREIVELTMYIPGTTSENEQDQYANDSCKQQILTQVEHFMYDMAREDINEVDIRIKVEEKLFPAGSPENEQVKRDILTGQGPDLFYFLGGLTSPFQYESGLADLEPFFENSERVQSDDLNPTVFQAGRINGTLKTAVCSYAAPVLATSEESLEANGLGALTCAEYGSLNSMLETPQIKERGDSFTALQSEDADLLRIHSQSYHLLDLLFMGQCVESYFDYNTASVDFPDTFASFYEDYQELLSREDVRMTAEEKREFLQNHPSSEDTQKTGDSLFRLQSSLKIWEEEDLTPTGVMLRMPGETGNFAFPVDMVSISSTVKRERQDRAFQFIESMLSPDSNGSYPEYFMNFHISNTAREKAEQGTRKYYERQGGKMEDIVPWLVWYYDQVEQISSCKIFDEYYYTQVFQPIMEDEGRPLEQRVRELENRTSLYLKE